MNIFCRTVLMPRLRTAILGAAIAVSAGCATSALARPPVAEDPVGHICRATLGVQPGASQYDACVNSLSGSLRAFSGNGAVLAARDVCLDSGLQERTPALAECTLKGADRAASAPKADAVADPGPPASSYFSASRQEKVAREQLACARIGLNPRLSAFDGCVAGLRAAMFASDNPSN
jgi:hypothetical protein